MSDVGCRASDPQQSEEWRCAERSRQQSSDPSCWSRPARSLPLGWPAASADTAPAPGTITTVAGTGTPGYSGDGGPAASAEIDNPEDVAVDASGDTQIGDDGNLRRPEGLPGRHDHHTRGRQRYVRLLGFTTDRRPMRS